jgi:putative phosphotransacetylase
LRGADQVELSLADARSIGVAAPIRESGDVAGSVGCVLKGPKGEVALEEGVIAAQRHIHATPADACALGVADQQVVNVSYKGAKRAIVFGDVVVRVRDDFALAMHIDTDEANAGGVAVNDAVGEIN